MIRMDQIILINIQDPKQDEWTQCIEERSPEFFPPQTTCHLRFPSLFWSIVLCTVLEP